MPHYIKSLELQGYKTFANRTYFEFAERVTAIVGPNGSGKSNIVDALRWVLGEQSFGLLRGKRTDDMIFSGSEQRVRAGMASVTVVFDNSSQWLPIDFSEVSLSRRAYRDGQNEYLINGQKVRLKDVNELLSQAGLAERTYTIIGQGLVDVALSLRAEERRKLFEEAAGIGLHRMRREEALRRLETTKRNLERVQDIIAELEPRLKSLESQAERVMKYEQIQADLRLVLREWYGYHWHQRQKELLEAQKTAQEHEAALLSARAEQARIAAILTSLREEQQNQRQQLNNLHLQLSQLHRQREEISRDLAVFTERERSLKEQVLITQAELNRIQEEFALFQEQLQQTELDLQQQQTEAEEAQNQVEQARRNVQVRLHERSQIEQAIQAQRKQLSDLYARRDRLQARISEKQLQAKRQQQNLINLHASIQKAELALNSLQKEVQLASQTREKIQQEYQLRSKEVEQARRAVQEAEIQIQTLKEEENNLRAQHAKRKAQLEVLLQAEKTLTGYSQGTKVLLDASRKEKIKGIKGALIASLEVPADLENAIAAVLGEFIHAVVVDQENHTDQALDLIEQKAVRAVLLPQAVQTVSHDSSQHLSHEGVIGIAAQFVNAPDHLKSIVQLLLGNAFIVQDRQTARRISSTLPIGACAVTKKGEVFFANGTIIGGKSHSDAESSLLSRSRQLKELTEITQQMEKQLQAVEQNLAVHITNKRSLETKVQIAEQKEREAQQNVQATEKQIQQLQLTVQQNQHQLQWQQKQSKQLEEEIIAADREINQMLAELQEIKDQISLAQEKQRSLQNDLAALPLDELQNNLSYWETQAAVTQRMLAETDQRRKEREASLNRIEKSIYQLEQRLQELDVAANQLEQNQSELRQKESEVQQKISSLQKLSAPLEQIIQEIEKQQADILKEDELSRQALSRAEQRNAQASILLAKAQEALRNLRQKIEDDFGLVSFDYVPNLSGPTPLPLDGMVESLPFVAELPPDLEDSLHNYRRQLKRLGAINPEARREFQEVKDRYNFLTNQVQDLLAAEQDVRHIINELDSLMQKQFRDTFETVSEEFERVFTRLFGGGSVKLLLTDPNDLINTGIDIEARLPGRRAQGLSLLSGGERSLTATALIFALLKTSPTPFCVLDEVDAMLDEANVGRFRDLLNEVSQNTQIIIITHNRNTVQVADVIYGVTMDRDSTSQVLSLRLDQLPELKGVAE